MSSDDLIPDDMDEGMVLPAPPPLGDDEDPSLYSPAPYGDVELIVAQLTSLAEAREDEEVVSQIVDSISVFDGPSVHEFMKALKSFLAPETAGDSQARRVYLESLPGVVGSKCRCDTQWYAREGVDNIAFGCKTCAMSSASCICVACFEAGDHEGHDFYISRSDYGCCDCGDIYAWKKSGFCSNHSGPDPRDDPSARLDEWTRRCTGLVVEGVVAGLESFMSSPEAIAANTGAMEVWFQFLQDVAFLHDGLRREIGRSLLNNSDRFLEQSHLFAPMSRQLWTKLLVDLMLDLEFKSEFANVFARHYQRMIMSRLGNRKMNDIGDLTCQMFTRPDVAMRLSMDHKLVSRLLETAGEVLHQAMVDVVPAAIDAGPSHGFTAHMSFRNLIDNILEGSFELEYFEPDENPDGTAPPVFTFGEQDEEPDAEPRPPVETTDSLSIRVLDHGHQFIKNHDAFQCSMDLIYILDHPEVAEELDFLKTYWEPFLKIMECLQFMNPHKRRTDAHMEFPDPHWAAALTAQGDLISSFWLILETLLRLGRFDAIEEMATRAFSKLVEWTDRFSCIQDQLGDVASLFCPLNRLTGILLTAAASPEVVARVLPDTDSVATLLDLPLKARAFNSQALLGLWVRNGESVNMEARFYQAPFFHFHLCSADLSTMRICILRLSHLKSLELFFTKSSAVQTEESIENLNGYLHLLALLMSQQTELALDEEGLVAQRITALLAVKDRTFSQLKDLKLERWTKTLTPKQTGMTENVLSSIAEFVNGGPSYRLVDTQWLSLDLVSPFYDWRQIQSAEERLFDYLARKKMTLSDWFKCNQTVQPIAAVQFRDAFTSFISSEWILASVFYSLSHSVTHRDDFRSLKMTIHIILRLCYPAGPSWITNECRSPIGTGGVSQPPVAQIETSDLNALAKCFNDQAWCHPWSLRIVYPNCHETETGDSVLSLLRRLETREENSEMRQWLKLAIEQTSHQCLSTREKSSIETTVRQPTSDGAVADRKRKQLELLKRVTRKQDQFLNRTTSSSTHPQEVVTTTKNECVVCLSGSDRPVGVMGYIAASAWHPFRPREFIPTQEALIPAALPDSHFLPYSSNYTQPRHVISRSCGHTMHEECWRELNESQQVAREMRGFVLCPYCNRPANVLFDIPQLYSEVVRTVRSIQMSRHEIPPSVLIMRLIRPQLDQIALSLRKPSVETDMSSLERALACLVRLARHLHVGLTPESTIAHLSTEKVVAVLLRNPEDIDRSSVAALLREEFASHIEQSESSGLSFLYYAHVVWHYLVDSLHDLPFDEILTVESMLSLSGEYQLLVDQVPFGPLPPLTSLGEGMLTFPEGRIDQRYLDSYIKRERVRSIDHRSVEYWPSLIPVLPSIYQKLYTAYLKAKCVVCASVPRQSVVCLVCGRLVCLQSDCCGSGEITDHFSNYCAINGIGIFLQLSNAEVHLISAEPDRTMVAQWGSLYLDSHGEEDLNLSKPLQLSQARVDKLEKEIRENSWLWKQGSKNLSWRRPIGLI